MSDAVETRIVGQTAQDIVVHLTNRSDGTGESAVIKVDKSTLTAADGAEPAALDIMRVAWSCEGMVATLLWDHATDDNALHLGGRGDVDFRSKDLDVVPGNCMLKDPRSSGGAGDILLTTTGHTSGDTYNITLWLRKQSD